jgi:hypothetical protein
MLLKEPADPVAAVGCRLREPAFVNDGLGKLVIAVIRYL